MYVANDETSAKIKTKQSLDLQKRKENWLQDTLEKIKLVNVNYVLISIFFWWTNYINES